MMQKLALWIVYPLLMRNFLRIIVGVKYIQLDALKKSKNFIIVSNHNSHLDTMAILSALPYSKLKITHPIAAADYFGNSPLRSFFTKFFVNAILINRSRKNQTENPIDIMDKVLKKGESIILFPEGTRGEPETMQQFKKGIGILLKKNPEIPYIPVFMKGMGKVLPRGEILLVPYLTYVYFGDPVYCKSNDIDEIVIEIEESIKKLANKFH